MSTVKVQRDGRIVIPTEIRQRLQIRPGDRLWVFHIGNRVYLSPFPDDPIQDARGFLPPEPSLSEELLAERQRDGRKNS
jgi:AbrB family looped-hinge helix DNA binding protein